MTKNGAHRDLVEFWDVGGADEDGVAGILELHLDAHLAVAHYQLGRRVCRLHLQQALQVHWPTRRQDTNASIFEVETHKCAGESG